MITARELRKILCTVHEDSIICIRVENQGKIASDDPIITIENRYLGMQEKEDGTKDEAYEERVVILL